MRKSKYLGNRRNHLLEVSLQNEYTLHLAAGRNTSPLTEQSLIKTHTADIVVNIQILR